MSTFTLELLHAADQEAGAAAVFDAPRFSAVLNALRAEDLGNDGIEDNTLTLSSGDAFIPGLFFDASTAAFGSAGIADIAIQNELGFQAIALGNHEFDFGTEVLADLIDGSAPGVVLGEDFAGADFPYLSTNLVFASDPDLAPLEVPGGAAPVANSVTSSVVIDVNGENVGVVGATTPTLASISSPDGVGVLPSPFDANPTPAQLDALAAEIQAEVDQLIADTAGLNKIVLLAHMQQITIERELAARLENVDIIVAGGSNTRLFDDNDRIRDGDSDQGQYPDFITNAGGTQTALVNTDGSYKYVGRLVIDFDADGNIIPESYDETVSGAYATDAQGVSDLNAEDLVDPEIQQIVDAIQQQIIATEGNVFGVSDVFLNGNRSGIETADDPDGVRTQETNLGNLTADANLVEAQEIDPSVVISLKNGGGIRASIGETIVPPGGTEPVRTPNSGVLDADGTVIKPEGGISQNDIQTTLAFNNGLTLLTLTKTEIVALLEHGVGAIPDVSGRFPQVSGVKFSYDPDLPVGDRILSAGIFDEDDTLIAELVRDGEIVGDANAEFRIVTLDFLAAPRFDEAGEFVGGGDGYPFPNLSTDPLAGVLGDPDVIARVNAVALEQEGVRTGDATFADDGTEQDALAEYLEDNFLETPFAEGETGRALDERIQNLNFRDDAVFEDATGTGPFEIGLYDADTDELLITLSDGAEISTALLAGRDVTIAAFETTETARDIESVRLDLNDGEATRVENVDPYALFGDKDGNFFGGNDGAFKIGDNTLSLELFSEDRAQGDLVDEIEIYFTIVEESSGGSETDGLSLFLINAINQATIGEIVDGGTIAIGPDAKTSALSVAAFVDGDSFALGDVESVFLNLNNGEAVRGENVEPYTLFGDSPRSGDVFRGTIETGANELELTFYAEDQLNDELGRVTIDFTLVEDTVI